MARSVTFGGQTLFKPGGLTRVNANALTPIGFTATGIVGLIGEADAGPPNEIVTIDDPALASEVFRSGALADAIRGAFDPSNDPRIPGGAFRCLCYKVNQSTQAGIHLPGATTLIADTVAAAPPSTTTVIQLTVGGLVVNAHINRWLKIGTETRRIVSNTASTVTVTPGFSSAPANPTAVVILNDEMLFTSRDYGVHTNQISVEFEQGVGTDTFVITVDEGATVNQSPDLGGTPWLELLYVGGPIPANGSGNITAATTSTITLDVAAPAGLNAFAGMVLQFADGKQRLIASNTAADPTVITLDPAHVLTAAEATAAVGEAAVVRNVTSAAASIGGTFGSAKTLTSVVAPTADNLNITFGANQTLRQLVDFINANTNYRAAVPNGINQDTTLMASFDFGTRATSVDVRFDQEIDPQNKGNFRRDLQVALDWVNEFSTLATAVRASAGTTEGAQIPAFTGGVATVPQDIAVFFIGGTRGTSTNSQWQAGFDAMLEVRANHIVPLIAQDLVNEGNGSTATFASVAAQLSDHVTQCRGIAKSERGGYIGGQLTKTQLLNQASSLNNTDVELMGQKLTLLDVNGNLVEQPEWSAAVNAAGMRSGTIEVGEPLTFKFIKTSGLSQDTSWSPRNRTDINQLIAGGVMFAEQVVGKGFRWVRDLTTYLIDDNIAFSEGSTRECVRFVAYDLRTSLEDEFTGEKATPANVANIREFCAAKLVTYVDQNILVFSLDPETQTTIVPGWRRLRVFITGNVATIRVEVFPAVGVTFELTDLFLQLPRLAA